MTSARGYRLRQLLLAALTLNAVRPLRSPRAGIGAFFYGWLTVELAPHLLAVDAIDTTAHLVRRRRRFDPIGLALAALSALGLSILVRQATQVRRVLDEALEQGLGVDYAAQLDRKPSPAESALPWRSIARPLRIFLAETPGVRVVRDVSFTEAGRRGRLDLYLPTAPADGPAPVLVQVHGGAWILGRKDQQAIPLMRHLAAKGWICVAINYRLAPRHPFPAQIIDVKRALSWVRDNIADYGGDPDYIALTGGSAGGHLTALAALTPGDPAFQPGFEDADTSVRCAIPFYGVYDFAGATGLRSAELMRDRFLARAVLRRSFAEAPAEFHAASPILRVTPEAPDFFVIHGAADTLVEVGQGRLFAARLREVSRRAVVYAELPGAQHAFDVFPSIRSEHVVRAVDRFLHWHWDRYRRELAGQRTQIVPSDSAAGA